MARQLGKVKYQKEIGLLVSKSEVEEEQFLLARTVRDSAMSISKRVGHKLLNKKSLHEITKIIDDEVLKVLENLSR